ncbi:hypothetical protein [Rubinisphaera sp. JC750]|uniref:hypothetical protein n=1 Tax=Rubinisphaera sp. JC750 TaxID=2898658 RepID=UPI001F2F4917|nr:hypothetical protein [Rubinisphaera sp. JC750]
MNPDGPAGIGPRIIAGAFGLAFGGIGLSVLIGMWVAPFGAFHSPPLFFRVFASFIAIPFVAVGFGGLYGAITGMPLTGMQNRFQHTSTLDTSGTRSSRSPMQTDCPRCAAPIGDAEISPSGDVKCVHCNNWFNVNHTSHG